MMVKTFLSALNEKRDSARSEDEINIRKSANGNPLKPPKLTFKNQPVFQMIKIKPPSQIAPYKFQILDILQLKDLE